VVDIDRLRIKLLASHGNLQAEKTEKAQVNGKRKNDFLLLRCGVFTRMKTDSVLEQLSSKNKVGFQNH
jgi:hypothetical protein